MTITASASGVDIARIALKAAQEAARARGADAPSGRSATTRPARRTTLRTGRDPVSFADALAGLAAERAWNAPTAGGGVLDQWAAIAPELVGKVTPAHYDPHTGFLDLRPASPAYATQLRLLGRQLIARINGKMGSTVVRDLRVLPPRAIPGTTPAAPETKRAIPAEPDAPVKTRDDASAGYHRALAAHQSVQPTRASTNPAIAAAITRQTQHLLDHREPESAFAEAVATKEADDQAAARIAAATSSQALAERRARNDKALRAGAVPLRPASPPMTSGAA
ncbi:DciA family protein [Kitasatospora humi]|uniref:DciA family protein n=1 Tax=Kitasatospora humi TaxID=2893891 RepID=UPI0027DF1B47|nr:DciA family protein [Kitasatospora humi]